MNWCASQSFSHSRWITRLSIHRAPPCLGTKYSTGTNWLEFGRTAYMMSPDHAWSTYRSPPISHGPCCGVLKPQEDPCHERSQSADSTSFASSISLLDNWNSPL